MSGFKKNTAVTGFPFALVSATDGSAITTGTVTGYYTLDGGTQGTIAGTATHEGNGQWSVNLTAAEMNGDVVGLLFTHASAIPVHFTIKTDTKIVSDLNDIAATSIVSGGAITTSSGAVSTVTSVTNGVTVSGTITTLDGLNNFDPATDTVANVTTVATVTNDVGVNEWNGVALGTTNPLPNAAAGAAGGLPTDSTGKTSFNDISAAQVNTEVADVLKTDVITLPGQTAPPATPTMEQAIAYLYKFLRNKKTATNSTITVFNDAGTVADHTTTISDNGTTYTEEEWVAGV